MGKFPIFQSPELDEVEKRMRPSPDFRHGFLGNDQRKLITILRDDQDTVNALGLTDEGIARRLRALTDEGEKGQGDPVTVEDKFVIQVHAARGKIPCPWPHPGLYRKTRVELTKIGTSEELAWTDLAIHLIEEHGFYQGKGSPYRLDPAELKRILEL